MSSSNSFQSRTRNSRRWKGGGASASASSSFPGVSGSSSPSANAACDPSHLLVELVADDRLRFPELALGLGLALRLLDVALDLVADLAPQPVELVLLARLGAAAGVLEEVRLRLREALLEDGLGLGRGVGLALRLGALPLAPLEPGGAHGGGVVHIARSLLRRREAPAIWVARRSSFFAGAV